MSRPSGSVIGGSGGGLAANVTSGIWTTDQALVKKSTGNWPGSQPWGTYQIARSLRFNSADTTNLNRTFASAGNRRIFTLSFWLKRSRVGVDYEGLFASGNGTDQIRFENVDQLRFSLNSTVSGDLITTQVFRDVSAWYHIVFAVDTTQATSTNRVKIYVNGSQITSFTTSSYPTLNYECNFNSNVSHRLGIANDTSYPFNGYITEVYFVDGQALTPSSFGATNSLTGVWDPKAYDGTFGTNGFYLKFADNSGTTSTTLGKDSSSNGNNWTPNNFSVTAGAGNDSLVDTPTPYGTDTGLGGEVRGNYCTWSPVDIPDPSGTTWTLTLSNGNLDTATGGGEGLVNNTTLANFQIPTTGKWYWEILVTNVPTSAPTRGSIGIINQAAKNADGVDWVYADVAGVYAYSPSGDKVTSPNLGMTSYGNTYANNDIIGVAVNSDTGEIWFAKNNTWQNSGSPTGGTNAAFTGLVMSQGFQPGVGYWLGCTANFGQRPFAYTAPSGFKALCTTNLPEPTIGVTADTQAGKYFNTVTYTGNGNTSNQAITGVGFQPDFVWLKSRSGSYEHILSDSVRGAGKILYSSLNNAEATVTNFNSFDADGFSVDADGGASSFNENGTTYVAWNWKAGNSTSVNTNGTISSNVRVNTTSGFSIVTYTGTGSSGTVGHGLGVAPKMILLKSRSNNLGWSVYHASLGSTQELILNSTAAAATSVYYWGNTDPTSTVFSLFGGGANNNTTNYTYIAYCFAAIAGFSEFGTYRGSGSSNGPFIFTGFRPAYIIVKASSTTGGWAIRDYKRGPYNAQAGELLAESGAAESSPGQALDFLSNGFKMRTTDAYYNTNGTTYIYAAFAEFPFKYSLAR